MQTTPLGNEEINGFEPDQTGGGVGSGHFCGFYYLSQAQAEPLSSSGKLGISFRSSVARNTYNRPWLATVSWPIDSITQ
ncbi:hypothetical protein QLX08_001925 [Tetragonisca angustula]|uniref:Uncharacterized protein n=1 Tax=Tetragonisca angustula TaxID=166442 RepID=A0AAW1AFE9_9HYME